MYAAKMDIQHFAHGLRWRFENPTTDLVSLSSLGHSGPFMPRS